MHLFAVRNKRRFKRIYIYIERNFLRCNSHLQRLPLFSRNSEKRAATMSRRSCLRRLGATKLYLNSRSWDGAAHGIGQWSMEEEHPVRSHRWPHRLPPFFCLFLSRIFAKRVSSSYRATQHSTSTRFHYPCSLHLERGGTEQYADTYSMNRDRSFAIVPSVSPPGPR